MLLLALFLPFPFLQGQEISLLLRADWDAMRCDGRGEWRRQRRKEEPGLLSLKERREEEERDVILLFASVIGVWSGQQQGPSILFMKHKLVFGNNGIEGRRKLSRVDPQSLPQSFAPLLFVVLQEK